MRVQLCGYFQLRELMRIGTKFLLAPCVIDPELLEKHQQQVLGILRASKVEDKFVDVSATVTYNQVEEDKIYAIVVYEEGKETPEQVDFVIKALKIIGLDVEEPVPIKFYSKKD